MKMKATIPQNYYLGINMRKKMAENVGSDFRSDSNQMINKELVDKPGNEWENKLEIESAMNLIDQLSNILRNDPQSLKIIRSLERHLLKLEKSPSITSEVTIKNSAQKSATAHKNGPIGGLGHKEKWPLPIEVQKIGEKAVAIFTDGACRGNPGPGAWAAIGQLGSGEVFFEQSGYEAATTNNQMELTGTIKALEYMNGHLNGQGIYPHSIPLFIYVDSKYVVDGATSWMPNWKRRGWLKADKGVPENLKLWQRLDELLSSFAAVRFVWVKGHSGHPQNEYCDLLCNQEMDKFIKL